MDRAPPGQGQPPMPRDQSPNSGVSNNSGKINNNAFQPRQTQPRSGQANVVQSEEGGAGARGQLDSFSTDNSGYYTEEGAAVQGGVPWGNRSIGCWGTIGANAVKCDFVGYG